MYETPQFKSINSSALSFLYSPTLTSIHDSGKTIALTRWTFVRKVVSLFFNMLSRFVIAFPPMRKFFVCLFVLCVCVWLHLPSVVILEPKKIKSRSNSSMNFQGPIRPGTHHLSDFILSPLLTPTNGSDPVYTT